MQIGMGNMELIMAANQSWSYHSLVELRAQSGLCNGFVQHSGESDGDSGGGKAGDQALGLMEQGGWKRGADCFDDHAIHVLMVLMFYY